MNSLIYYTIFEFITDSKESEIPIDNKYANIVEIVNMTLNIVDLHVSVSYYGPKQQKFVSVSVCVCGDGGGGIFLVINSSETFTRFHGREGLANETIFKVKEF